MSVAVPSGPGMYPVGTTNIEVAPAFVDVGDEAMHEILLGRADEPQDRLFITDILRHPESAWIVDVEVPEQLDLYGPATGKTLPVAVFIAYPGPADEYPNRYAFPYHDARYGAFENMLEAGEMPVLADPDERYPLVVLAHGAESHGIYDAGHAQALASHGYIVAVPVYGDDRTGATAASNLHRAFLRPLLTEAVLDSILESEAFGPYIDTENIGISGHSFGGFTSLAVAGGPVLGNSASVRDERFKAAVIAAPWTGGEYDGEDLFAFGPGNAALRRVDIPVICLFGTRDEATLASFILPATEQLSGPTYVIELVDQPHVFDGGSWQDRDNWELVFFNAYLKHDPAALATLKSSRSMQGGSEDLQRFDYQRAGGR